MERFISNYHSQQKAHHPMNKFILILMSALVFYGGLQFSPRLSANADYRAGGTVVNSAPTVPPVFGRGFTDIQVQPCRNDHTRERYESELISKNETAHNLISVGATVEQADILSAISHAESGSQLNCFGDDDVKYYGKPTSDGRHWGASYGLYQVRTILEASGSGECRDIERLRNNVVEQSKCAYELSRNGTKFSPTWSMYSNGRYAKWLGASW